MKNLPTTAVQCGFLVVWITTQQSSCLAWTTTTTPSTFRLQHQPCLSSLASAPTGRRTALYAEQADDEEVSVDTIEFESEEQKKEAVGNLVADDEWNGLSMELSEVV